jgi:hypothetical protein
VEGHVKISIVLLAALFHVGACAPLSNPDPEGRTRPEDLGTFAQYVEEDLTAHAWQTLLSSSDPDHYQMRVVDGAVEEPVYLAELFGLHREGNDIQDGEELDWEDLDRIESASVAPANAGPPSRLTGSVTLTGGETLEVEVGVREVQGRFVLAGADG